MKIKKRQEIVKQNIKDNCLSCFGNGCKECAAKLEKINLWSKAGIPPLYWDFSLQTFNGDVNFKEKIKEYINNLDQIYINGKSYSFVGRFGVGKTWGANEILKAASVKGYTSKYTTMAEIISILLSNEGYNFKNEILDADFLCVDEIDTRFLPNSDLGKEMFGSNIENIIRTRFQHKLPIFFCSNNTSLKELFDGLFGQALDSLFTQSLIEIPVGGIDLRKNGS
jgi:DNA replication protein DnaC